MDVGDRRTPLRERAQEVQRRDGLVVALHEPLRVGYARLGRGLVGVDDVTAERCSSTPSTTSVGDVRGFANCPAILPTLTTGSVAAYVRTADICSSTFRRSRIAGADVVERLDAVACLEQERALADLAERHEQRPRLAREDERRQTLESVAHGRERVRSGQSGCWAAARLRHDDGVHVESVRLIGE